MLASCWAIGRRVAEAVKALASLMLRAVGLAVNRRFFEDVAAVPFFECLLFFFREDVLPEPALEVEDLELSLCFAVCGFCPIPLSDIAQATMKPHTAVSGCLAQ